VLNDTGIDGDRMELDTPLEQKIVVATADANPQQIHGRRQQSICKESSD
jgi:hypothetical protein